MEIPFALKINQECGFLMPAPDRQIIISVIDFTLLKIIQLSEIPEWRHLSKFSPKYGCNFIAVKPN